MAQLARTSFHERMQRLEESLSPLATRSYPALRDEPEPDSDHRTPFQRDRDRIAYREASGATITYGQLVEAMQARPRRSHGPTFIEGGNRIEFVIGFLSAMNAGASALLEVNTALAPHPDPLPEAEGIRK
jgi:hypothetical protein